MIHPMPVTINGKDYLPGVLYPADGDMPKDREFLAFCKKDFPAEEWSSFKPYDDETIGIFQFLVEECCLDYIEGWVILKWDDPSTGELNWFMTGSHLTLDAIVGNPVWWTPLPETPVV